MIGQPYVITILVTAGYPDGVRMVEKSNWTGRGTVFARPDLAVAAEQGSASPGVYVPLGDDPSDDVETQVNVGQAEDVSVRLRQHVKDDAKDWWRTTIVFQSGNQSLNRAHISFLESELVRLATEARRVNVANGNQPSTPHMAAVDHAVASGFLGEMLAIFPMIGVDAFERPAPTTSVERRYFLGERDSSGEGVVRSEGFLVFAGADARIDTAPSFPRSRERLRQRLQDNGRLVEKGGQLVLAEDVLFRSPSAAAGFLTGGSINGREVWRDKNGVTLKQHQIDEVGAQDV
ncbi:MAG: GIY-YIG nuclease family protein [Actinomycetota bacterium]